MRKPKLKYSVSIGVFLKIFINGIIHVCIKEDDFVGFQSWVMGTDRWAIEYYTKHKTIYCEYDDFEKWTLILKLLNQNL